MRTITAHVVQIIQNVVIIAQSSTVYILQLSCRVCWHILCRDSQVATDACVEALEHALCFRYTSYVELLFVFHDLYKAFHFLHGNNLSRV